MKTKLFEVRDKATFIPVCASLCLVSKESLSDKENYLLRRAGFNQEGCILLSRLEGEECHYDPYDWGDRTMTTAHDYIQRNFDNLESGAVVDCEFILKEATIEKVSERFDRY